MDTPHFTHDHTCCTFVGRAMDLDVYVCHENTGFPSVLARFGNEGSEYLSIYFRALTNDPEVMRTLDGAPVCSVEYHAVATLLREKGYIVGKEWQTGVKRTKAHAIRVLTKFYADPDWRESPTMFRGGMHFILGQLLPNKSDREISALVQPMWDASEYANGGYEGCAEAVWEKVIEPNLR